MGAILKGRDPDLGRDVAIKVLARGPPRQRRPGPPVRRGGADRRPVAASGRRADLRAGDVRRPAAVLQHEAGEGADAGRPARGPLGPGRRPAPVPVDLRGHRADDGLRPHPRRDPSRPEAVERDGGQLRRGPGDGLGPGQGPAARRRRRRCEGGQGAARGDADRHGAERLGHGPLPRRLGPGHAQLHGPRAGPGRDRPDRRAGRRLRAGLDPLRDPHRPPAFTGRRPTRSSARRPGATRPTPWPGWTAAGPRPS